MRAYLRIFALTFGLALALAALVARVIDPYGFWGAPRWEGVNRFKPSTNRHLPAVKLAQVARIQPQLIVAGNSRVGVGFDPLSSAWPRDTGPVYNLGVAGAHAEQLADVVVAALDKTRPSELILGVDLIDFRVWEHRWRTGGRWSPPPLVSLPERAQMLISLDALADSAQTVAEQRNPWPMTVRADGFNPLLDYNGVVAEVGHAAIFAKRVADNSAKYRAGPKAVAWPEPGNSRAWRALDRIRAACAKRGIKLTLVTYPYHASLLQAFADTGLWPAFEDWQRRLAVYGAAHNLPVWDFSRITPETSEAVPPLGDTRTKMRWYWEGGHFKSALGDEMIRDVMGRGPPSLGVRIIPANVESVIVETRARLPRPPR